MTDTKNDDPWASAPQQTGSFGGGDKPEPGPEAEATRQFVEPEPDWAVRAPAKDFTEARLRLMEPFAANMIGKLPKPFKKDSPRSNCRECGGFHGAGIHLDYVGHAALTHRLLEVDPTWTWEPMALDADGLPKFDKIGGLWIRLTVCDVTRLGYGHPDGKSGGNAIKEAIGDALRNAGMRFGAALALWHKGDLYEADEESGKVGPREESKPASKPKASSRSTASKPKAEPKAKPSTSKTPDEELTEPQLLRREIGQKANEIKAGPIPTFSPQNIADILASLGVKDKLSDVEDVEVLQKVLTHLQDTLEPPF